MSCAHLRISLLRDQAPSLTVQMHVLILGTPITIITVNTEHRLKPEVPHTGFNRVLSFLLLSLILYGTTFQAVHKHGGILGNSDRSEAVSQADFIPGEKSTSSTASCHDCLICQLHQSVSTTLITERSFDSPDDQIVLFSPNDEHSFSSIVSTTKTGRAPPFTS